jgi:predicted house-cleaning noncanonical NTP pyrophosphatase (MazG superfamily)
MNKEDLEKLSPETLEKLTDALHEELCKAITLVKDSLNNPGITKEEIRSAREFAELKPNTKAAQTLFEFLESEEVKKALVE